MVAMIIQKAESIYGSNTNAWPPEIAQLVREATVSWNTTTTVLHQHLGLVVLKDVMCGVSDSDFLSRGTFSKWLLMIAALDDGLGLTACVAGSGARSCEALVARAKLNVNTAADGIVERSNGRLTRQDVNMAFDYADAEAGVACEMFPINQGV